MRYQSASEKSTVKFDMTESSMKKFGCEPNLSVLGFYKNKSILVTGGTGFMGKVLIEKLLRSCTGIDKIYLLMRPKRGKTIQDRLEEMFTLPLYDLVKNQDKNVLNKVVPIKGDTGELGLGLSPEDKQILVENVSVVFHSAASVRFDDPLKKAILLNLRGAHEMVKLALEMKNLKSFVHVSTTYCNAHVKVVEEKIYPPPDNDWRALIRLAENIDEHSMEVLCRKIIGVYLNTYTFTKALAEQVINDYKDSIPSSILRPSIVVSTLFEPMPGWIDNFNGPMGLSVGRGKGVLRTMLAREELLVDYMPVDLGVQSMILLAWDRANSKSFITCNNSSYGLHHFTTGEMKEAGFSVSKEVPMDNILWFPGGIDTAHKHLFYVLAILLHFIPALIIDTLLKITKKRPVNLLRIQRRAYVANIAVSHFLLNAWDFKNSNFLSIDEKVLESERSVFPPVPRNTDTTDFMRNAAFGVRTYLLKEKPSRLPKARIQFERMYWLDKAAKSAFLVVISYSAVKLHMIQFLSTILRSVHHTVLPTI